MSTQLGEAADRLKEDLFSCCERQVGDKGGQAVWGALWWLGMGTFSVHLSSHVLQWDRTIQVVAEKLDDWII